MSLKQNPDQTDEHLISLLTANARVSAALLARKVGLSRSAVQQRLRRLEQQGIIEGYSVVLKTIPVHPQGGGQWSWWCWNHVNRNG
ncbi:MAG: winged helix-turn-helix transcriptional regulator [Rhodospirillaceae bacterium]|nr:winged helix-turn-helix transcriptional regulator [Rhodospirillaceae bacterium]